MNPRTQFPAESECQPYYFTYINELRGNQDIVRALSDQRGGLRALAHGIPNAAASTRPAPDEWSIKEIVGHLIDCERLYVFRALWFARGETHPLPGMMPDPWVDNTRFNARTLAQLLDEWEHNRAATIHLFDGLDDDGWLRAGVASGNPMSVRAIAWIIAGHELHHLESLREKYISQR